MLRYQIGAEALEAVIEYLPSQYSKRMLNSRSQRAAYITTFLESKQRPFIWEHFRPGTIEIAREEEAYYDEVSSHLSRAQNYSKYYTPETSRPISVNPRPSCLLNILHLIWHPDAASI